MNQDEVSPRGRALWNALIGFDANGRPGVGRQIVEALASLSDEDVRLLRSELQQLWHAVGDEAQRRESKHTG